MWILWRTDPNRATGPILLWVPRWIRSVRGVGVPWIPDDGPSPVLHSPARTCPESDVIRPDSVHILLHRCDLRPHDSAVFGSRGLWKHVDECGDPNDIRVIPQCRGGPVPHPADHPLSGLREPIPRLRRCPQEDPFSTGFSTGVDNVDDPSTAGSGFSDMRRAPPNDVDGARTSAAGRSVAALLALDLVGQLGDLVVDRAALRHELADLAVGMDHGGVVAAAQLLADLRQGHLGQLT